MYVTRAWRVFGTEGHRQRESFAKSHTIALDDRADVFSVAVFNSDKTGTNEYSVVVISGLTAEACERELWGQVSDGIFENSRVGTVEEVNPAVTLEDTAEWMSSGDYRRRFAAEYVQTEIRLERLCRVLEKLERGEADFKPDCTFDLLQQQVRSMREYLVILQARAEIEGVDVCAMRWMGRF